MSESMHGKGNDCYMNSHGQMSKYKHVGCNFIRLSELSDIEPFFDEHFYRFSDEAKDAGIRPVEHYLVLGERQGAAPSKDFDPVFYARQYPDVREYNFSRFRHYIIQGRSAGRTGRSRVHEVALPAEQIDPDRRTILLLFHEAAKSDAPILGWNILNELKSQYNVVAVVMKGGSIENAIRADATATVELPRGMKLGGYEIRLLAQKLKDVYRPHYVIANSALTQKLAVSLEDCGVPVVALVHEFACDMPPGILNDLYGKASRIVFSATIAARDSQENCVALRGRAITILPHGPLRLPGKSKSAAASEKEEGSFVAPFVKDDRFTVFGMGTVAYRKGVDLFVASADFLHRDMNRRDIRFIWLGPVDPKEAAYKMALDLQVKHCNLQGVVEFIDEVDDLAPYLGAADLLFLSSRTDSLPCVAMDALLQGIPITCFNNASGISDILSEHENTRSLVAPYASVSGAARIIARAMDDQANVSSATSLQKQKTALKKLAAELFDLEAYVEKIDEFGNEAATHLDHMQKETVRILDAGVFNKELYFGDAGQAMDDTKAISNYLNNLRLNWPLARRDTGRRIRRPLVGFNPLIYDFKNPVQQGVFRDPLSAFLNKGSPAGPWLHRVFEPSLQSEPSRLKAAIHGHFHYPELLGEFLRSLEINQSRPDLFITTTSETARVEINRELERSGWSAFEVWVVPNQGRDIFPFIKELPARLGKNYDIVGHLHGKKSKHLPLQMGTRWRNFAWQHLVGDQHPMVDTILAAFAKHPDIGLVFPEDPHLFGWEVNEESATRLAVSMGIAIPLPIHFDFPVGTMFWARPDALQPLFELDLDLSEIPVEPLALDGTTLHALERLIPMVVAKAGFDYATTHVAGINR